MRAATRLAARAAVDTDDGGVILKRLATELRTQRFVLPSAVALELGRTPQLLRGERQCRELGARTHRHDSGLD